MAGPGLGAGGGSSVWSQLQSLLVAKVDGRVGPAVSGGGDGHVTRGQGGTQAR